MLGFAVTIALVSTLIVLSPFVLAKPGILASAQSLNSAPQLEQLKIQIIKGFLSDEQAYKEKLINKYMWEQRRLYWVHRYVDVARRLDFVRGR